MNTLHMIGNTHFDPVWLWTWDEGMAGIRSTFRSALLRMKEDKNYIYSFCCPPVFEWIKETDEEMFNQICERVKEGRWDLSEGWYLQPDCNVPCGESFVRQGLYGQMYLLENFGKYADTVFNIDSFGHNAMLPQILKKSRLPYYIFSRPNEGEKTLPDALFRWQAKDGSEVMAYRFGGSGGDCYSQDIKGSINNISAALINSEHDLMMGYGISNHGGAPTKKSINDINEVIAKENKAFNIKYSSTSDFFKAQKDKKLPIVTDELQVKFFGVFSNNTEVKSNNRKSEYALLNAEKAALLAETIHNKKYPHDKLRCAWQDVLFNQFHDILGGSSITQAYEDARNLHGRAMQTASEILHTSLQNIAKDINMPGQTHSDVDWNIIIFNLNSTDYKGAVEAEVQWVWELDWYKDELFVTDEAGIEYPCQIIRELSVIPAFRSRIVFKAEIPQMGYKVFNLHQKKIPVIKNINENVYCIENEYLRIKINEKNGCISEIYDKTTEKAVLFDVFEPYVRQDDGDTWGFNVTGYAERLEDFHLVSAQIIEAGKVETVIKTKAVFRDSFIEQYFTLYNGESYVDCEYRVNWNEKHKVLKLGIKSDMQNPELTAAIPYGNIGRSFDGKEYPVGEWLKVSENNNGYTVLLSNIFAYDTQGKDLGLTVLRSPVSGDLRIGELDEKVDYEYLEQGITEGKLRLMIHNNKNSMEKIPEAATQFNNPVIVIAEANHEGSLPTEQCFIKIIAEHTTLSVVKKAENKNGDTILRLYEYNGSPEQVKIKLFNNELSVNMGPYEIKTIKVDSSNNAVEVDMLEISMF